jgi:hypothetical protein
VKGIDINLGSKYSLESQVSFDYPHALFQLGLYERIGGSIEGGNRLEELG